MNTPTHILSIDPGLTTGVGFVRIYDGELVSQYLITYVHELAKLVQQTGMNKSQPSFCVIEDFVGAGPRTLEAIYVLKLIGRLEANCEFVDMPYALRSPAMRLPLVHDAEKRVNRGTSPHVIAAYAHALAFIERGIYEPVDR